MEDTGNNNVEILNKHLIRHNFCLPSEQFEELDLDVGKVFKCHLLVQAYSIVVHGEGYTKKAARNDAAEKAVEKIKVKVAEPRKIDASYRGKPKQNPVSALMEFCDAQKQAKPSFQTLSDKEGPDGKQFLLRCSVGEFDVDAIGTSKKIAKRTAAKRLLKTLNRELLKHDISDSSSDEERGDYFEKDEQEAKILDFSFKNLEEYQGTSAELVSKYQSDTAATELSSNLVPLDELMEETDLSDSIIPDVSDKCFVKLEAGQSCRLYHELQLAVSNYPALKMDLYKYKICDGTCKRFLCKLELSDDSKSERREYVNMSSGYNLNKVVERLSFLALRQSELLGGTVNDLLRHSRTNLEST